MKIDIKLQSPLNNKQVKIVKILKNTGDKIQQGETLFEVEADKSNTSIKPEAVGIVESINVVEGEVVTGDKILAIVEGEKAAETQKNAPVGFGYFGNLMKPSKVEMNADITIIGGGPGGYVAAIHAAKLGASVVLVEKDTMGGTCLNRGCIPTKSFVHSARVYDTLKNAEEFGCSASGIDLDMKKVVLRKNQVVNKLVQGIKYLMDKNKVKVVYGSGEIVNKEEVLVKGNLQETRIKTKNIIIATGSKPAVLPVQGSDITGVISSNEALEMQSLPKKMVIVGGGVIGMEFAFIFASFGVKVSVVEYMDECLISCDSDIIEENRKNASKKGIKLYTGSKVEEIRKTEDGECIVSFTKDNEKKHVTGEVVLMSVGRIPCIEGIGIEGIGIELNDNKKGIKVNSKLQTNIPNIYAIGDVTNRMLLAHVASHQGITAVDNIMGKPHEMDYDVVPSAIFTDPEIAMVGIGEKAAEKMGIEIEVGKFPFAANGKALTAGEEGGFIKIIKDKNAGRIIGASIIGIHATDMISELTLAIKNNLSAEDIIKTIHPHPTTAEVVHEAALALEGGAIHLA